MDALLFKVRLAATLRTADGTHFLNVLYYLFEFIIECGVHHGTLSLPFLGTCLALLYASHFHGHGKQTVNIAAKPRFAQVRFKKQSRQQKACFRNMNGCSAILRAISSPLPYIHKMPRVPSCHTLRRWYRHPPTPASFRKAERLKVLQQPERRVRVRDTRAAVR